MDWEETSDTTPSFFPPFSHPGFCFTGGTSIEFFSPLPLHVFQQLSRESERNKGNVAGEQQGLEKMYCQRLGVLNKVQLCNGRRKLFSQRGVSSQD